MVELFNRYYKELDEFLKLADMNPAAISFNVYLDNTHFQPKTRRIFFDHLNTWKKKYVNTVFEVTAIVLATPFELCLQR